VADLGYVGFAVDMYGDGKTVTDVKDKTALIQPLLENRALLLARITTALDTIKTISQVDITRIAAIGFCFGGLCALDLARNGADIRGAVSFHGNLTPPQKTAPSPGSITPSILALHGYEDPMVPSAQVDAFNQEMTAAKADWQVHIYGNTQHSFTNPQANHPDMGLLYNKNADRRSWQTMKNFLAEIFA